MHSSRDADVVNIGLLFEIEMHALYVLDFEIAFPERGRINAIAENCAAADSGPNASQALDREPQSVFI